MKKPNKRKGESQREFTTRMAQWQDHVSNEYADDVGEYIMAGGDPKKAVHYLKDELKRELAAGEAKVIEEIAEAQAAKWDAFKPIERKVMRLRKREFDLRKDAMNALLSLELEDPHAIREAHKIAGKVFGAEHQQKEEDLQQALLFLRTQKAEGELVDSLSERYLTLYPAPQETNGPDSD